MTACCPVCRRDVHRVSKTTGHVPRHNDTARNPCPMSGRHIPTEWIERRAA